MSSEPLIPVKRFDHLTIIVSDIEATRKFYEGVLGMDVVPRPDFPFPGLWLQKGDVQIHATLESDNAGKAGWGDRGVGRPSHGHHFAFEVDDCEKATATAREHGIEIASGPQTRPDGIRQVYFYDPDRHVVELYSEA